MERWKFLPLVGVAIVATASAVQAQSTGRITGTVTTEGRPLPGVNVVVLGTNPVRGTVSDGQGRYTLTGLASGTFEVQARLIGYAPVTNRVTVDGNGGSATSDFTVLRQAVQLEGLVTVGYGTQERRTLTGAVQTVAAEKLAIAPVSDPMKALQGKVAGVDIVQAGNVPGAAANVRIRGVRSLTASNEPLFVVDGIPISGAASLTDFNPQTIETIEVLKDASATAIYGSRGANGVILITTKRGVAGVPTRTTFSLEAYTGPSSPLKLIDMMTGPQHVQYLKDANAYAGRDTTLSVILTPKRLALYNQGIYSNWQDVTLRNGMTRSVQGSATGSGQTNSYSLSGNYYQQDGLIPTQAYTRGTVNATVDHRGDRLRLGLSANLARVANDIGYGNDFGFIYAMTPFGTPYDSVGNYDPRPDDDQLNINPLLESQSFVRTTNTNRIFGSMYGEVKLLEGLSYRLNFGPDLTSYTDGRFNDRWTHNAVDGTQNQGKPPQGYYGTQSTLNYTLDNLLLYNHNFGSAHKLNATLVYGIQNSSLTSTSQRSTDLPYSEQLWYNLGSGTIAAETSNLSEWALQSIAARVNYTLLDRYTLELNGRRDGSSRLAPGNKWTSFPSVGVSWQLGDEPFMRNLPSLSSLKLRGSYGTTGNTSINPYQTQGALGRRVYNFGAANGFGFGPGTIPSPNLTWEKTDQTDVALDFGFFDNRVSGTLDWYKQQTYDLLQNRALPATSGYTQVLQNIGATENRGFEASLSTNNVNDWHGLSWSTDVNFTINRNEITGLVGGVDSIPANNLFVGRPIHLGGDGLRQVFYNYKFMGIWQYSDSAEIRKFNANGATYKPGGIRVADLNGDYRIDAANDRMIVGTTYPRWTGNLYNRFAFKGFDLAAVVQAKIGYTIVDGRPNALGGRFGNINQSYWTPTNPDPLNPAPAVDELAILYNDARRLTSGSHWRVRTVTLGYTFGQNIARRVGANSLRLYGTAQDPYVNAAFEGLDPENGTGGGVPAIKTFVFGARANW